MYISNSRTSYDNHGQHAGRAPFLILVQPKDISVNQLKDYPPRALVRKVAMSQCGHFMMGFARVFGKTITVSGSFGSDGLPTDVPMDIYERATPLPDNILHAYNNIDDWAGTGQRYKAVLRIWAKELI